MSQHESFLKAIRVEPNDLFHEQIYCDFLRDEGYEPPEEYLPIARLLAQHLHSARQSLYLPRGIRLGPFGVTVLVSCTHLTALREICLRGRGLDRDARGKPRWVDPNIDEEGVVRLVHSSLMKQIRSLDLRFNAVGPRGVDALLASPYLDGLESLEVSEPEDVLPQADLDRLVDRFGKCLTSSR